MGVYLYPSNTETPLKEAYIGIPFPESIVLDRSSISLTTIGQTVQLTATIEPTVSDHSVTWSSDDTTVATVSTTGLVTCVTPGECTITAATVNGLTATCSVDEKTVQTFDFQNDGSLNWTGYSIGYGTPDYVTGQGWKIGTSNSGSYQGGITIPNSVFQGELKSIKMYWYKPSTTQSSHGSAVGICNQNQSAVCEYGRFGTGGTIMINGNTISAIDPTGGITTEWIMEDNGDLTVKINDTSYNIGSYASTFKDLRTNKALYIEMGRWANPPHYIRKIEITTA